MKANNAHKILMELDIIHGYTYVLGSDHEILNNRQLKISD